MKGNISQRRNPLISDMFRRIEIVAAWGRGMPLILKYAPDVVFLETGNLFIVAFNRPSFLEQTSEATIQDEPTAIQKTSQKTRQKTSHKELFANEKAVIDIIKQHPTITRKKLAEELNLSEAGVRYNTDKLQAKGILRRVGGKKAGKWEIIEGSLNALGDDGVGG